MMTSSFTTASEDDFMQSQLIPTEKEDLLEEGDHRVGSTEKRPSSSSSSSLTEPQNQLPQPSCMSFFSICNPSLAYSTILDEETESPLHSLSEFYGTIFVPEHDPNSPWYKTLLSFVGPGLMVAVGYMDPGNWSTDIAGGSAFGYKLLIVIATSSIMAMLLQYLALKVGIATSKDLAQICRDTYPKHLVWILWITMEIAICATDVAEVIGSAVALKLLFGVPLFAGVCITALDVFILLLMHGRRFRVIECMVGLLIMVIAASFLAQLVISRPDPIALFSGFIPRSEILTNKEMLFVAIGIIGATVMPHNLFLHSSIVLTRNINRENDEAVQNAIKFSTIDSNVSLMFAFFVNAAILIVSSATFHKDGYTDVATLEDAYQLLDPLLHSSAASTLFAVALLASGQNSTLTGTLTGQIVMEGFMTWKIPPTYRRIATRLLAIVPAVIVTGVGGDDSANYLLILSQVILSFALPFAVIPLVHISSSSEIMGPYVNHIATKIAASVVACIIVVLNVVLMV